jgi:hypothetical protein
MKKNFLLRWLVAPLGVTSIALFVVSFWVNDPWRSLLINLAAGLIGSIITVLFVEKVIRWKEREEWAEVLDHVGKQVNILANGTTSSIRLALGLPLPRPENEFEVVHNPRLMRQMMINLIEKELLPRISQLAEMNQKAWNTFARNMQGSVADTERIMSLFSRNLDPVIMELILDIHEQARGLLGHYMTWPDLLGVSFEELKPNNRGESMVPFMKAEYKLIISEAERLLKTCAQLLREIDEHFPG